MADAPKITLNLDAHLNIFLKASAGHLGDMRQALRAIEEGTYAENARRQAPGAVMQLGMGDPGNTDDAVVRHTSRCFRSTIADFITFLDQVIGATRLLEKGLQVPPEGLADAGRRSRICRIIPTKGNTGSCVRHDPSQP